MRPFQFQFQFQQQQHPTSSHNIFGGGGEGRREEEGMMTFTAGQRQELERQTVIYKYMMASMPVPPQLLLPLNHSAPGNEDVQVVGRRGSKNGGGGGGGGRLEALRYATTTTSSNNREVKERGGVGGVGDREPWRCRRTDGKKWRCSRDVAPDHKYCERHSHKGRPSRSRKPVESPSQSQSQSQSQSHSPLASNAVASSTTSTSTNPSSAYYCNPITLRPPPSSSLDSLPHYNHFTSRYPDEFYMRKQHVSVGIPLCPQQQIHPDIATDHRSANSSTSANDADDRSGGSLLQRPFIDAWSLHDPNDNNNNNDKDAPSHGAPTMITTATSSPLHSILPLTLGIDHHNNTRGNHDNHNHNHNHNHQQPLNWMTSWISSPPGGPLAEALCLGMGGPGTNSSTDDDELFLSHHAHTTSSATTTTTTTITTTTGS